MTPKQQFNIYLPSDLVKRLKHAALDPWTIEFSRASP